MKLNERINNFIKQMTTALVPYKPQEHTLATVKPAPVASFKPPKPPALKPPTVPSPRSASLPIRDTAPTININLKRPRNTVEPPAAELPAGKVPPPSATVPPAGNVQPPPASGWQSFNWQRTPKGKPQPVAPPPARDMRTGVQGALNPRKPRPTDWLGLLGENLAPKGPGYQSPEDFVDDYKDSQKVAQAIREFLSRREA